MPINEDNIVFEKTALVLRPADPHEAVRIELDFAQGMGKVTDGLQQKDIGWLQSRQGLRLITIKARSLMDYNQLISLTNYNQSKVIEYNKGEVIYRL